MDSPVSDRVGGRRTWHDALFARFRPSDYHVSDDEVFAILHPSSDGPTTADLCAAKGVTVPMYCVWKAKYRYLDLDELRAARRWEFMRYRLPLGVLVVAAAVGTAGIVFGRAPAAPANIAVATGSPSPVATGSPSPITAPPRTESAAGELQRSGNPPPAAAPAPAPAAPVEERPPADAAPAITEPGYKIQVVAANSLDQGRVILERLASAGYPAYLSKATVRNIEVFRVRIGPFDTLPAAEEIASQLKLAGYDGVWIAR